MRTYSRISADSHIDMPWMPNDLFTSNASAALKDRMPYVADGPDGPYWTCKNGMSFGLVCGVGPGGAKYVPGQNYRVEKMHAAGLYDDAKKGQRRVIDPHLRVKDQDLDGVDAEVLFGILGAATRLNDHDAAKEMFRIYNDWLVDFCKPYPDRLLGLACLPYGDIQAAIDETHRVAKRGGIRGLELSCSWDMEPMYDPSWEPLWQAVNEVNLPLHFHTFPSTPPGVRDKATGLTRRAALFTGVSSFQMNLINILSAIMGSLNLAKRRMIEGEDVSRFMDNALQAAQRGATLTQRMLAFARKQQLQVEPVDLIECVRDMTELLGRTIGPGVQIRTEFPLLLPPVLARLASR